MNRQCLLCGSEENPTDEHIVPQTLWRRFGIDPDRDDLAVFRTTLCDPHNQATSALHRRREMMQLIETGEKVTRKTLQHLGDWAVWVTLLLGLARGSGVLGESVSRAQLLRRFDSDRAGLPRGVRVYTARISAYVGPAEPPITPYMLALKEDPRVLLDASGRPVGHDVMVGPIAASESIGLRKVALLVVGDTYSSGPEHRDQLDAAAATLGLERIFPTPAELPELVPIPVSMRDVGRLFTVLPFGSDPSLLPDAIASAWTRLDPDEARAEA